MLKEFNKEIVDVKEFIDHILELRGTPQLINLKGGNEKSDANPASDFLILFSL